MDSNQKINPDPQDAQTSSVQQVSPPKQQSPSTSQYTPPADPTIPANGDRKSFLKSKILIIVVTVIGLLLLSGGAYWAFFNFPRVAYNKMIADCISKGGAIGESYPPTCIYPSPPESPDSTSDWSEFYFQYLNMVMEYPQNLVFERTENVLQKSEKLKFETTEKTYMTIEAPSCVTGGFYSEEYDLNKEITILNITTPRYKSKTPSAYGLGYTNYKIPFIAGLEENICMFISIDVRKDRDSSDLSVFDQILSTFKFINSNGQSSYSCPTNGWVNCMPILTPEAQKACSDEAIVWYKANCPNFQGIAQ